MPKDLNSAGKKAAKAYAVSFLAKYDVAIATAARTLLSKGVGGKLGTATGTKLTGLINTSFTDTRRGCKRAEVKLHPHNDVYNEMGGTDALANVPDALVDIKKVFVNEKFISGHVLNAEFGGDGADPANQTVLTSGANSQHHFDEHVKSAWTFMTKAWEEMYKFTEDSAGRTYMENLRNKWAIHIVAVVDDASWLDTYSIDASLAADPNVVNKYPLNCVTTEVVFTATELNGPTENDIATNLKIDSNKMDQLGRYISTFREHMSQATKFVVKQAAPATFAGRSPVSAEATDGTGTTTPTTSHAWKNTLKVAATKGKAAAKAAAKTVQSYLTKTDGTDIDLVDGDNEIGATTAGYPWVGVVTDLKESPIFYILTDNTGGPARMSLERGVKVRVEVDGTRLKTSPSQTLPVGGKIRVFDNQAPNTDHCYEFTYGQK